MKNWPKNLSLLDRPLLPLRLQVFIGEIQRVEEHEDRSVDTQKKDKISDISSTV